MQETIWYDLIFLFFVEEFDQLFNQFGQLKPYIIFSDDIKVFILMESLQNTFQLASYLASLKLQDYDN